MPRSVNPGSIPTGTGLAAKDSVEANALVHPTGGNDGLRVHIQDPSRAHEARAIHVEDVPGNFVSDHVEGALEELAGATASGRSNGLVEGGTWTDVGNIITLDTPTTVQINGSNHDYSGASVVLPNGVNYVFIDVSAATLTSSVTAPTLPSEDVLIAEITVVAGFVTASRDGRFFIFNLDRKLPITVRSDGVSANQRSEAAHLTLEAALLHLELYAGFGSVNAKETHRIIVRGGHTISATTTLPIPSIFFEGDGDASFTTGFSGVMFDLNGMSDIRFKDILFTCDHAASTAIEDGSTTNRLTVERCRFVSGASDWTNGINLADTTANNSGHIVSDSVIRAQTGIVIGRPAYCHVVNCRVIGGSATTGIGIELGQTTTLGAGKSTIRGCTVESFETGIQAEGHDLLVGDTHVREVETGLVHAGGLRLFVRDSTFILDATAGRDGISISAAQAKISGCYIENPRTVWGAPTTTTGISISAAGVTVTDCRIVGFLETFGSTGDGILLTGAADTVISDCFIDLARFGIESTAVGDASLKVSGTKIRRTETGIFLSAAAARVSDSDIEFDAARGLFGIIIAVSTANNCKLTNCSITSTRPAASYGVSTPGGISVAGADRVSIENVHISGVFSSTSPSFGISASTAGTDFLSVQGGYIEGPSIGIVVGGARANISGVQFNDVGTVILLTGTNGTVTGCNGSLSSTYGVVGVSATTTSAGTRVSDCNFTLARIAPWAGETPNGVALQGNNSSVVNCRLDGFYNVVDDLGFGIQIATSPDDIQVLGNRVSDTKTGIAIQTGTHRVLVQGNVVDAVTFYGIRLLGDVIDATVTENMIDGFLSATPFNPTAEAGISVELSGGLTPSHLSITDNEVQRCKNGILASGDIADPVIDITINGNTVHHCAFAQVGAGADSFLGAGSKGIGVEHGRQVVMNSNNVLNIGQIVNNAGTNAFPTLAGPDVASKGVYLRNCARVTVNGNSVTDILSTGLGSGSGIFFDQRSSGIGAASTFLVRDVILSDNHVFWDTGLPGNGKGNNGIVVTCTLGADPVTSDHALRNVVVSNNVIRNTAFASIATTIGDKTLLRGLVIEGNVAAGPDTDGILVLLYKPVAALGLSTFEDVTVDGNSISAPGGSGIVLQAINGDSFAKMAVKNNVIADAGDRGISITAGDVAVVSAISVDGNTLTDCVGDAGILGEVIDATAAFSDFTASGNTFKDCPRGVRLLVTAAAAPVAFGNFKIDGNQILNTTFAAIAVEPFDLDLSDVTISGNSISESSGAGVGGKLIEVSPTISVLTFLTVNRLLISDNVGHGDGTAIGIHLDIPGTLVNTTISGNITILEAGSNRAMRINLDTGVALGADEFSRGLIITGNEFVGGDGVQIDTHNDLKLWNLIFSNNVIRESGKAGLLLEVLDVTAGTLAASAHNWVIAGNSFISNALTGLTINFGDAATAITFAVDISITDNKFSLNNNTLGNDVFALLVESNCTLGDLSITDNSFDVNGNATPSSSTQGVIDIQLSQDAGTLATQNIQVCRNQVLNLVGGFGIYIHQSTWGATSTLRGLDVNDNQIHGIAIFGKRDGIRVDLTGFAADSATINPGDISIDENTVTKIAHGSASDVGIVFIGTSLVDTENVSVSRNKVSNTGNGDGVSVLGAISLNFSDPVYHLIVDGNEIQGPANAGVYCTTAAVRNVSVSRNQVHLPTGTEGNGVKVVLGGIATNLAVNENKVYDPNVDGVYVSATNAIDNAQIEGNQVWGAAGYGVIFVSTAVGTHENISVSRNIVQDSGGAASILVEHPNGMNQLSVCHNIENNSTDFGIDVKLADTAGDTIACSIIGNQSRSSGTSGIRFRHLNSTDGVFGLQISDNVVTAPGSSGISVSSDGAVHASAITSNMIYNSGSTSLLLDLDGGVHGLHVDGNTVQVSDTDGIHLDLDDTAANYRMLSVNYNQVYDVDGDGIEIEFNTLSDTAVANEFEVIGNQIRNFATDNAFVGEYHGIRIYKRGVVGSDFRHITVANNQVSIFIPANPPEHEGDRFGILMDVQAIESVERVLVSGNIVSMTTVIDAAKTAHAMQVLVGAGGPVLPRNWVFSNNILKVGVLTFGGGSWPPTFSIAVGNISDDAVDNWTAFTAGFTVSANNIDNG
jgi:hypothetical protein